MTRLLVSVRNAEEALAAVKGGADILDIKEPHFGSLGCATPLTICEIAKTLGSQIVRPPLSLALGELVEWQEERTNLRQAIQTAMPQFLKLGLARCRTTWRSDWQQVRLAIPGEHTWVAVAYADSNTAVSPPVETVLNAALETGCTVLLLDTHTKSDASLLDYLSLRELEMIREKTEQHGLKLALAGRVTFRILESVLRIKPDIIAVRGAVCDNEVRTATVSEVLVQKFREAVYDSPSRPPRVMP